MLLQFAPGTFQSEIDWILDLAQFHRRSPEAVRHPDDLWLLRLLLKGKLSARPRRWILASARIHLDDLAKQGVAFTPEAFQP